MFGPLAAAVAASLVHSGWQTSPKQVALTQTAAEPHSAVLVQGPVLTFNWMQAHLPSTVSTQMQVAAQRTKSSGKTEPQAVPHGGSGAQRGVACAYAGIRRLERTGAVQATAAPAPIRFSMLRREIWSFNSSGSIHSPPFDDRRVDRNQPSLGAPPDRGIARRS